MQTQSKSTSDTLAAAQASLAESRDRMLRLLSFVPEDKLHWSPSPTSRSAIQILAHCGLVNSGIATVIAGKMPAEMPPPEAFFAQLRAAEAQFTDRESVVALLTSSTEDLLAVMGAVDDAAMGTSPNSPFGPMPMPFWLSLTSGHLDGHAGQLEYLQTIWGDLDPHMG